jgi:hypothetical protein
MLHGRFLPKVFKSGQSSVLMASRRRNFLSTHAGAQCAKSGQRGGQFRLESADGSRLERLGASRAEAIGGSGPRPVIITYRPRPRRDYEYQINKMRRNIPINAQISKVNAPTKASIKNERPSFVLLENSIAAIATMAAPPAYRNHPHQCRSKGFTPWASALRGFRLRLHLQDGAITSSNFKHRMTAGGRRRGARASFPLLLTSNAQYIPQQGGAESDMAIVSMPEADGVLIQVSAN